MAAVELFTLVHREVTLTIAEVQPVEFWELPESTGISRQQAYKFLCLQRRHNFHPTNLSKWCADLGISKGVKHFSRSQFMLLQRLNIHLANGGKKEDLLTKLENEGAI